MPIQSLGVRVRAWLVRAKGHVQVADIRFNFSRAATIRTQRRGNRESPSVFAEVPPLIAEQATRSALWMSTAKQSFVLKIEKHAAKPIRRAMKMLAECGDVP